VRGANLIELLSRAAKLLILTPENTQAMILFKVCITDPGVEWGGNVTTYAPAAFSHLYE
jgi:hypothetical protein